MEKFFRNTRRPATPDGGQEEAFRRNQMRTNNLLIVFNLLLVVVTGVSSVIAIWQARIAKIAADAATNAANTGMQTLQEMQTGSGARDTAILAKQAIRSADASVRSSEAAATANRVHINAFRGEQRPYLILVDAAIAEMRVIDHGPDVGKYEMTVSMKNFGKSPAMITQTTAHLYTLDRGLNPEDLATESDVARLAVAPGEIYRFRAVARQLSVSPPTLPSPMPMLLYGDIRYTDIFGSPLPSYETSLCHTIMAADYNLHPEACFGKNFVH